MGERDDDERKRQTKLERGGRRRRTRRRRRREKLWVLSRGRRTSRADELKSKALSGRSVL